jgi:hypothetical protein
MGATVALTGCRFTPISKYALVGGCGFHASDCPRRALSLDSATSPVLTVASVADRY